MKVYMYQHGITLVGKAWQIKAKLKEYNKMHHLLHEFLEANEKALHHSKKVIQFPILPKKADFED